MSGTIATQLHIVQRRVKGNRLVKVTRKQDTDIVIQTAEYDGLGRRVQKVVAKSGDLDGTFSYFYDGWKIVQINTGAELFQQVFHGTQYIDEIVAMRFEKGYAVVYQDANWNTVATCDLAGRVLERVFTTPYGSPIIEPETFFGDYDGDGDVDSTDDASLGSGQTCWGTPSGACRVFDFNSDGTLNASDETIMTSLVAAPSTNRRHENRTVAPSGMAFLHQGLALQLETALYENRYRNFAQPLQRFAQRDPLYANVSTAEHLISPESRNLYSYIQCNPSFSSDPTGLSGLCDTDCYKHWLIEMQLCGRLWGVEWQVCMQSANEELARCASWNTDGCANGSPYPTDGFCCYPSDYYYEGVNAQCMCECMGDDTWSQYVRSCLACYYTNGCPAHQSHEICYKVGDAKAPRPVAKLIKCAFKCLFE